MPRWPQDEPPRAGRSMTITGAVAAAARGVTSNHALPESLLADLTEMRAPPSCTSAPLLVRTAGPGSARRVITAAWPTGSPTAFRRGRSLAVTFTNKAAGEMRELHRAWFRPTSPVGGPPPVLPRRRACACCAGTPTPACRRTSTIYDTGDQPRGGEDRDQGGRSRRGGVEPGAMHSAISKAKTIFVDAAGVRPLRAATSASATSPGSSRRTSR